MLYDLVGGPCWPVLMTSGCTFKYGVTEHFHISLRPSATTQGQQGAPGASAAGTCCCCGARAKRTLGSHSSQPTRRKLNTAHRDLLQRRHSQLLFFPLDVLTARHLCRHLSRIPHHHGRSLLSSPSLSVHPVLVNFDFLLCPHPNPLNDQETTRFPIWNLVLRASWNHPQTLPKRPY